MPRTSIAAAIVVLCAVFGLAGVGFAQDGAARLTILNATMSADGDLVTISGTGFGPAPLVTIDGQPVAILAGATDTQVTVITPAVLLTAPGTYRLTVVDSVRQVGEVFVVASRAEPSPAVSVTTNDSSSAASAAADSVVQPRATSAATVTPDGASGAPPVGTFAIEDPGTPFRTALGFEALAANTSGIDNTAIGYQGLAANTSGNKNTALGYQALLTNTSSYGNTALGASALHDNTTGDGNTAAGVDALFRNTVGHHNTATGQGALTGNTNGNDNTATGAFALLFNRGSDNTASGAEALIQNDYGSFNTAVGSGALYQNLRGNNNTATGYWALASNNSTLAGPDLSGEYNTATGVRALYSNSYGSYNTAVGYEAGSTAGGTYNVFLGAGVTGQGSNTIRIGSKYNGANNPKSGQNRTFIAGIRDTTVAAGLPVFIDADGQLGTSSQGTPFDVTGFVRSTGTAGAPSSGAGLELLYNQGSGGIGQLQAYDHDASRYRTLFLDGAATVINGSSNGSVGIGTTAPTAKLDVAGFIRTTATSGAPTVGAGLEMLYSGGLGQVQAYDRDGAGYQTLLLDGAIMALNAVSGGNVGIGTTAPEHPLHMASGAYVSAGGVWTNASSRTLKDQIADLPASRALEAFAHLKPVTFVYKASPAESHVGFIAEEVPDLVATQDRRSLAAMDLIAVLTKVVQEQQQQLIDHQATDAELRARLARLETLLMCAAAGGK